MGKDTRSVSASQAHPSPSQCYSLDNAVSRFQDSPKRTMLRPRRISSEGGFLFTAEPDEAEWYNPLAPPEPRD